MNQLRKTLLAILFLMPISAFAHGEEVFATFLIQAISVVVFVIIIIAIKVNLMHKLALTCIYLLTSFAIFYLTNDWPYRENMNLINFLVALVPAAAFYIAYLVIKSLSKK